MNFCFITSHLQTLGNTLIYSISSFLFPPPPQSDSPYFQPSTPLQLSWSNDVISLKRDIASKSDYWWSSESQMEHVQEVIRLVLETADNGQFYFEISMIMYCGIQLTLFSSLAFKLHNLKLMPVSYKEQCRSEGRDHCLLLKPERNSLLAGQGNGTFQGMVTDPGMLSNFLVISTFPVLPVACCSRLTIREIKKYDWKSCSAYLCISNQSFLRFSDQMEVISLWENQGIHNYYLSFSFIWWSNARIWRIPFLSFLLNFKFISHADILNSIPWMNHILVTVIFGIVSS